MGGGTGKLFNEITVSAVQNEKRFGDLLHNSVRDYTVHLRVVKVVIYYMKLYVWYHNYKRKWKS